MMDDFPTPLSPKNTILTFCLIDYNDSFLSISIIFEVYNKVIRNVCHATNSIAVLQLIIYVLIQYLDRVAKA